MTRVLVCGATRGLGFSYSEHLFSRNLNEIFIVSRKLNPDMKFVASNKNFMALDYDSLSDTQLEKFKAWIINDVKPDVVIHFTGGGLGLKNPALSGKDFIKLLNANILGEIALNSILLEYFKQKNDGMILHIGSTAATHAVGSVGYNSAKSALNAYVRSAGNHFIKFNILIMGINIGAFMAKDNSMQRLKERNPTAFGNFINTRLPRGFMIPLGEINQLLDFLIDYRLKAFAGCMIPFDAGESLAY